MKSIEELLSSLDRTPEHVVVAARQSFRCRAAGDQLAELTYDSSEDLLGLTSSVRGTSTRQLCFATEDSSVEIELREDAQLLVGQLIPSGPVEIELTIPSGSEAGDVRWRERADEVGRFAIDDVPAGPIRLRWTASSGRQVSTEWFRS